MFKLFSTPREIFSASEPLDCPTCPSEQVSAWACTQGANVLEVVVESKLAQDKVRARPRYEPNPPRRLGRLGLRDSSY